MFFFCGTARSLYSWVWIGCADGKERAIKSLNYTHLLHLQNKWASMLFLLCGSLSLLYAYLIPLLLFGEVQGKKIHFSILSWSMMPKCWNSRRYFSWRYFEWAIKLMMIFLFGWTGLRIIIGHQHERIFLLMWMREHKTE